MELEILYQDEYFVAVNKPHGLLVHKTSIAEEQNNFALQILRDQLNKYLYPIHRLDRKTSGILLFAFDKETAKQLQETLQKEETVKQYYAIVRGYFPEKENVDHALTNYKGKVQEAQTYFECLTQTEIDLPNGKFNTARYSLVACYPKTGRMHQIRKHLNHLRHPIIGDRPHGCNKQNRILLEKFGLTEMMLHSRSLTLFHPRSKQQICIEASFSATFLKMAEALKISLLNVNQK